MVNMLTSPAKGDYSMWDKCLGNVASNQNINKNGT